jgi:beta-glucosidase-like glycosyl hydrolase
MGEKFLIGKHNAVGTTGSANHAYAFGKAVGVEGRKMGYNVVCDPVVDMAVGSMRSLGTDKEKVTELAMAIAKGMHDGGVLNVAKHYPGAKQAFAVDSHMAESTSLNTKEELLDYYLYPYLKLNEAGLLDGIMTGHKRLVNIDDKYPTSLSKKSIDIIREQGYNGFCITDGMCMMGIRAKFADIEAKGLALNAGNDIRLTYMRNNKYQFEEYMKAYNEGRISDEMLDEAVKRVLEAQHKTTLLPTDTELTDEEIATFKSINKDGIYTKIDEGVPTSISRDGRHYFIISVKQDTDVREIKPDIDTFSNTWQNPSRIAAKIKELFPNARYKFIHEFPSQGEMTDAVNHTLDCDELVFMTFSEFLSNTGPEHITIRTTNLINAMQLTDRISTLIHIGNPKTIEVLSHVKRVIFGGLSEESVDTSLEVLAGIYPANGTPTYEFNLQ